MIIPPDAIYIISEYNDKIIDSISLSQINKEIYNNRDKIMLNYPTITDKNHKTVLEYSYKKFKFADSIKVIDPNIYFQKINEYIITNVNNLNNIPENTKKLIISIDKYSEIINLENLKINSIKINVTKGSKIILPNILTHLSFGEIFNRSLILPNNLTHLVMGDNCNKSFNLPNSLTHLTMGSRYNRSITLPNSLTHLTFGNEFNRSITLPNSLTHLTMGDKFNRSITLPNNLTHLICGDKFNQSITLPNSLTHLTFGSNFNQSITLPNSLTHLTFGYHFNQPIILPNNLTHLTFGNHFNQPIILPNNLVHLEFSSCSAFNKKIDLIDNNTGKTFKNLESVILPHYFCNELLIGHTENKSKKIKISLDHYHFDKIFPNKQQIDFKYYILTNLDDNEKIDVIL